MIHPRHLCLAVSAVLIFLQPAWSDSHDSASTFGGLGPPPGTYQLLEEGAPIRIPFEIFRDDIRMLAEIEGKRFRMLIDNGSLWDQILFFGSERVDALELAYGEPIQVGGSGEGDPIWADTASDITIRFPGIEFAGQTAIITRASSGLTELWEGCEGQVSATFFKHFVVEIDFDDSVIVLHDPDTFEYRGSGREVIMEPAPAASFTIPATIERADGTAVEVPLMIDLGGVNAVELTTGARSGIPLPEKTVEDILGVGVQGKYTGHFGRVASVRIAGYRVKDVLAAFQPDQDEKTTYDEHQIGLPLLSRFNLIFDYHRQRLFIKPNRRFKNRFEHDMSGMRLKSNPDGAFEVIRVLPRTPASDAGLAEGDTILRINGKASDQFKLWDLYPLFRKPGKKVRLVISRDGEQREVRLTLRRLV